MEPNTGTEKQQHSKFKGTTVLKSAPPPKKLPEKLLKELGLDRQSCNNGNKTDGKNDDTTGDTKDYKKNNKTAAKNGSSTAAPSSRPLLFIDLTVHARERSRTPAWRERTHKKRKHK